MGRTPKTTAPTAVQKWMVMGMRKRLRELLLECGAWGANMTTSGIANYLIANDVVPVVRCKDCTNWFSRENGTHYCRRTGRYAATDDFCSYGERKDND